MYSVFAYGSMIADQVRMDAYVHALRHAIKPGSIVLDIGTGTGIFALLACQFGARRVYAIEPSNAIQVARDIAVDNRLADRIEFIQDISTRVVLPERADVIVSDLRGVLPLFEHHIPSIIDARQRLLISGGILIPRRDMLWAVIVEAPELYKSYSSPWDDNRYDLDMQRAVQTVTNTWSKGRLTLNQLLAEPYCWGKLDYTRIESPDVSTNLTWTVARAGTAHGLCVWFDAELAEGICFSNAPSKSELIYGHAFFPWSQPIAVTDGDTVTVSIHATLVGADYIWRWDTRMLDQNNPRKVKADFKQSTFYGVPLSPAQLCKMAASYVPTLSEDGQIDRFILDLINSHSSLEDIARSISARWASRFPTWGDALTRVGELSTRYSK